MPEVKAGSRHWGVEFIVTTSLKRPDGDDRKLIRSHVMLGKNRRKRLRELPSWINQVYHDTKDGDKQCESTPIVSIPGRLGSDLSLIRFPDAMEPYMIHDVIKFFTVIKNGMYPVELCVEFDPKNTTWYGYLLSDIVYLHSMIFTTQSYYDLQSGRNIGPVALVHFSKTVKLLQARLAANNDNESTSDSTIMAVMTLAMAAEVAGERDAAIHHMSGLQKLVNLRGGLEAFKGNNSMIQTKVCRADLGIALSFGCKPRFFSTLLTWNSYVASRGLVMGAQSQVDDEVSNFAHRLDEKLRFVWEDLQEFSRFANLAYQTSCKIKPGLFHEIMVSILYRLLHLAFHSDPLNEAIRAGMLMFATTLFLQWQGLRLRYTYTIEVFKNALHHLRLSTVGIPPSITLWLLMFWGMTVHPEAYMDWYITWFTDMLTRLKARTWPELSKHMSAIMWVGYLHDTPGQRIYEKIASGTELGEIASAPHPIEPLKAM